MFTEHEFTDAKKTTKIEQVYVSYPDWRIFPNADPAILH